MRLARLLILPLLLALAACNSTAAWFAGVDQREFIWDPLPGTKHQNGVGKDLSDCEAPTGTAAAASADVPSIRRAEASPAVAACMAAKGYRKAYQTPTGWF